MMRDDTGVTAQSVDDEAKLAQECLFQGRRLCVEIRNAGRFLSRGLDPEAFFDRTSTVYFLLRNRCKNCRDRKSAINFIRIANAGQHQPVRFDDWIVPTAHEAACYLFQSVINNYDPILCWDEHGERSGVTHSKAERLQDCRNLVRWTDSVTDALVEDLQVRIDMERDISLQKLFDRSTTKQDTGQVEPSRDLYSAKRYRPSELRKLFDIEQDTLLKRLKSQEIRNIRHNSKSYQIHKEDLPT